MQGQVWPKMSRLPESPIATIRPYFRYPKRIQFLIFVSINPINHVCAPDWSAWIQWWRKTDLLSLASPGAKVPPPLPYSPRGPPHTQEGGIDAGQPKKEINANYCVPKSQAVLNTWHVIFTAILRSNYYYFHCVNLKLVVCPRLQ